MRLKSVAVLCALVAGTFAVPLRGHAAEVFIASFRDITRHKLGPNGLIIALSNLRFHDPSDPIAVGADGTLYASLHTEGSPYSYPIILVYERGKTKPSRRINLYPAANFSCEYSGGAYITSLAVDSAGYLFVGYADTAGPLLPYRLVQSTSSGMPPCAGVQVFKPHAGEHSKPLFYFGVPSSTNPQGVYDMRAGADGSLYTLSSSQFGTMSVFGTPESQPTLLRSLAWGGPGILDSLSPDDPLGDVYVTATCGDNCLPSQVLTFPEQFTPSQLPTSSFDIPDPHLTYWWIDNLGSLIYVSWRGGARGRTMTFTKNVQGSNPPLQVLPFSGEIRVAP